MLTSPDLKGHDFKDCGKTRFRIALKGRGFSRAVPSPFTCHPEEAFRPTRDLFFDSFRGLFSRAGTRREKIRSLGPEGKLPQRLKPGSMAGRTVRLKACPFKALTHDRVLKVDLL
jgi:hypothetical protein